MTKIRGGKIGDVLEVFRRLSYEIEAINSRFDKPARTGQTLDDLKVKVYRHEAEMVNANTG